MVSTDNLVDYQAVPWVRGLIAGLSPRRSGFDHSPVHMRFVADKVALGQVFPRLSFQQRSILVDLLPTTCSYA
jgi:hypothetical protein